MDEDAEALEEAEVEDRLAQQDRTFALRFSHDDPDTESPPSEIMYLIKDKQKECDEKSWLQSILADLSRDDELSNDDTGPSLSYTIRQREALERLPLHKIDCIVCAETFPQQQTIHLPCSDVFCRGCLKSRSVAGTLQFGSKCEQCCRTCCG